MSFRPNMSAFIEGIRTLAPLRWRAWEGTVADLWEATGLEGGFGYYVSPDPRLVVFLDPDPAPLRLGEKPDGGTLGRIAFIPADQPIWSRVVETRPFRHLDLHFDQAVLHRRIGASAAVRADLTKPVLLDRHPQVERLAEMIAAEVAAPTQDDLVPQALAIAAVGMILGLPPRTGPARSQGGLTPAQMRRVTELMRTALQRKLSVAELAAAAGLSESWFAHAFRTTTGNSPARHLARLRIEEAQRLLSDEKRSIGEVAMATGFADQAHFTRAFRAATGTTPAAWRRLTGD